MATVEGQDQEPDLCSISSRSSSLEINANIEWGQTQSNLYKINYEWTINNFSFYKSTDPDKKLCSPTFYSNDNPTIKWKLVLVPGVEYISVYLKLISESETSDKLKIPAKFNFFILNSKQERYKDNYDLTHNFNAMECYGFPECIDMETLQDESNDLLPKDELLIYCEVTFICESKTIKSQKKMGDFKIPDCDVIEDFGKLLESGKLSDVTLVAGDHKYPAHKAILASRSDVFAAIFEHEMKENKLSLVNLPDEHHVLHEMLVFIYTDKAPKLEDMPIKLLAAADKYSLKKLKVMCEKYLYSDLAIETAAEVLVSADLFNADQLKEHTIKFIIINAKAVVRTKGWETMCSNETNLSLLALLFERLAIGESASCS
ncbi:protein roadkill-like [Eupeodes corollae]|uniref:protein roadkill-like n=1 Tax=Eupeodes corollae TaxID=290404 RepID=UPI002490FA67|nr:protein roadkill-like [Eupeodes corollae]